MDNSEFEIRAFANPEDQSQDFLDALKDDSSRERILEEAKALNEQLNHALTNVSVPEKLAAKLKSAVLTLADPAEAAPVVPIRSWQPMSKFALAACLVLALGITYSVLFTSENPSSADLAFSQQVMNHIYMEMDEINSSSVVDQDLVSEVIGSVGGQLRSNSAAENLAVSFVKPCNIIPESKSAHIALAGSQGPVNIIVVNNSPVSAEFTFDDSRFSGLVIPYNGGNLVIIGEKQESLTTYRELLSENVDFII
jgi:hypothetical protein